MVLRKPLCRFGPEFHSPINSTQREPERVVDGQANRLRKAPDWHAHPVKLFFLSEWVGATMREKKYTFHVVTARQ